MNVPGDDSDYYKIPPLGRHYTLRWAQEDLQVSEVFLYRDMTVCVTFPFFLTVTENKHNWDVTSHPKVM